MDWWCWVACRRVWGSHRRSNRVANREARVQGAQETRDADRAARAYVLAAYILTDAERIAHRARAAATLIPAEDATREVAIEACRRMLSLLGEMDASRITENLMHLSDFERRISGALATTPTIVDAVQTLTKSDAGKYLAERMTIIELVVSLRGLLGQMQRLADSLDEFLDAYRPQFVGA